MTAVSLASGGMWLPPPSSTALQGCFQGKSYLDHAAQSPLVQSKYQILTVFSTMEVFLPSQTSCANMRSASKQKAPLVHGVQNPH